MNVSEDLVLREARIEDGRAVWNLLGEIGELERNSCYTYLLMCTHFASTSIVAARGDQIVGFVLGYRPPSASDDVFVWQVGVAAEARGLGLGQRLLTALVALPACRSARYLTATVSPDNVPSLALFHGFAGRRGIPCVTSVGFPAACFACPHPDENLLRIGPM